MNKPWDLKIEDNRAVDDIYTFLIFCEDETSEVEYFRWFETELIKVNIIPKQKSMITNVIKAISHCKTNGIIAEDNSVVEGYQVWCVYDRDKVLHDAALLENDENFNVAHFVAEKHKINLAWSNDAFELWVVLHLQDVDCEDDDYKERKKYYALLDDYFSNRNNPNERLRKILAYGSFSYKKDLKHQKNFIQVVRNEILPFTEDAIRRSEELLEYHKTKSSALDKWSPCTLVHLLVRQLLDKGGKQLPVAV